MTLSNHLYNILRPS